MSDSDENLPLMCQSTSFRNYRSFVDKRKFDKRSAPTETKSDCCMLCRSVGDCFSFEFDSSKLQCNYYTTAEKLDHTSANTICPSGSGDGYLELPNYPLWPNHFGHEAGPCLSKASSGTLKTGHGLDLQGIKDSFDQAILDLPKDDSSDDDFTAYEL